MHKYIEYFDNAPLGVVVTLMAIFGFIQAVGELLEFKGKVVPEFMKVRKWFRRKRCERETLSEMTQLMPSLKKVPEALERTTELLNSVDMHYNKDNIAKRDGWISGVNSSIEDINRCMQEMSAKLDKNNEDTLAIRIDNMRTTIIDFASYVSDSSKQVTREQFARVFKMHKEYEKIITLNGLTNGEVDIAIRIVREAYEQHLRTHSFIEDSWDI